MAKITIEQVAALIGVTKLDFYKSKTPKSKRLVAFPPQGDKAKWIVMTNDGPFDFNKPIYGTVLVESAEHAWIADYDYAIQISNKEGEAPVHTLEIR